MTEQQTNNTARIQQGNSGEFISLKDNEKSLYKGCGYAIAYIDNNEITKSGLPTTL